MTVVNPWCHFLKHQQSEHKCRMHRASKLPWNKNGARHTPALQNVVCMSLQGALVANTVMPTCALA